MGKSRGGWGTKIHGAVSGLMLPVTVHLSAGQEADVSHAKKLLEAVPAGASVEAVIADKGYDSKDVVGAVEAMGAQAVIPTLSTRKEQRQVDKDLYKERDLAERFWRRLKDFRRVATRYEKTDVSSLAFVHLASLMILLQ